MSSDPSPQPRLLTFASGGWVFLVAAVLVLGIILWQVTYILPTLNRPVTGDGQNIDSYGFDLSNRAVPRELITASGFAKDGLPRLSDPQIVTAEDLPTIHKQLRKAHMGKALVDHELVVGVALGDQARAYPLRILALHEMYADALAGQSILVTYSPLSDSAVVFDRRVNGQVREFGISGLLYNSNTLLYDHNEDPNQQSLWSQLGFKAISGPAAGTELMLVPFQVLPWGAWLVQHPDSTAVLPPQNDFKRYKRVSYTMYYGAERIHYPVQPLPPEQGPNAFTPILAIPRDGGWTCVPIPELIASRPTADNDISTIAVADTPLNVTATPVSAWPQSVAGKPAIRALWFAWYAMHGEQSDVYWP